MTVWNLVKFWTWCTPQLLEHNSEGLALTLKRQNFTDDRQQRFWSKVLLLPYSLLSDVTVFCTDEIASSDVREAISLHQVVHM